MVLKRRLKKRQSVAAPSQEKCGEEFLDDFDIDQETEREISRRLAKMRNSVAFRNFPKLAVSKLSEQEKQAIIDKNVKSNFDQDLDELTEKEPDLPDEARNMMSERLSDALSTSGGMIIIIKPSEFQHSYLSALGRGNVADELGHRGLCFRPGAPPDPHFGLSGSIVPEVLHALMPLMIGRSAAAPCLNHRITLMKVVKRPKTPPVPVDHPLLNKVSSAYSAYRHDLIYKMPSLIKEAMKSSEFRNFWLDQWPYGGAGVVKEGSSVVESIVKMLPVSYANRAHLSEPVSRFVEDHCSLDGLCRAESYAQLSEMA